MSLFNYTIYYKDAQTGQDLASPVRVGYDNFSTLVSETQKSFNGYTARPIYGNDKTTPTKQEYQSNLPADYSTRLTQYQLAKARADRDRREYYNLVSDPNFYQHQGISVLEKYKTYATGSYSYFDNIRIFTDIPGVETLARPLSWGYQGYDGANKFNYSGKPGSKGDLGDNVEDFLLRNVSSTVSGKQVNLRIRLINYAKDTSIDDAVPGIWVAPYGVNKDGIGVWIYDAYKATLRFSFEDTYGNPLLIPITSAVSDIDFYQQINAYFSHSDRIYLSPPGSGLSVSSGYFGDAQGMRIEPNGEVNIPRGSFFLAGIGTSMTVDILGNLPGKPYISNPGHEGSRTSFEIGFFGNASRGEFLDYSVPHKPDLPTFNRSVTILYDKVAKLRPWAIRNSGQWVSFTTKQIDMIIRKRGKQDTSINAEDAGKLYGSTSTGVYLPTYSASGNAIRKDGTWKQQGKIGR